MLSTMQFVCGSVLEVFIKGEGARVYVNVCVPILFLEKSLFVLFRSLLLE